MAGVSRLIEWHCCLCTPLQPLDQTGPARPDLIVDSDTLHTFQK